MILILSIIVGVLVIYGIYAYNTFIKLTKRTEEAWADIDTQLKRRYDLIPNLIETVKGYAAHERGVFEEVTAARASATSTHVDASSVTAEQITAMAATESALGASLGKLLAVAEAYPDLKANQNFSQLQTELTDTENKIQAARRFYNANVRDFMIALESFPSNVIGNMFKFTPRAFFELGDDEAAARQPVKVSF